ncbi:MAG: hypothetical protein HOC74_32990 [Gemmatimonadetes bacterium]|jgi:hypothetical protein|nr:hypothetical protein [Gemmatimonadota bacterium]MBT7913750.1 hypothetical protein [Candidatus Bathyarchaeota archaeon]
MTKQLEELLQRKKLEQDRAAIDRPKRLEEWRFACSGLIDRTRRWLSPLEEKGYLTLSSELISIREEQLGEYEAPMLHVAFLTGRNLSFKPVGQSVIGALGRVDIVSSGESVVMLVFRGGDQWEFAKRESRYGSPRTWPYNEQSLEDFLTAFLED